MVGKNLPRVKGIIIDMRTGSIGMRDLARFQSLAEILIDFRDEHAKEVVIFSNFFTLSTYWFASAVASTGKLFLLRTGVLDTRGLLFEKEFFGSTFEKYGLKFEKVAVTGFKGAYDEFAKNRMADENRENYQWLLDDLYGQFTSGIQQSRKLTLEEITELVDSAPWFDTRALDKKFIDGLVQPDMLPVLLGSDKPARILPWSKIIKVLPIPALPKIKNCVGVICAAGGIMDGKSRTNPVPLPIPVPFFGNQLGDLTLNQAVRRAAAASHVKSVILYVDSGGGSVTASESMRGALVELAKRKPLTVYMGNVAASGGYYIATPGKKIMSQPGTVTGSIGVLTAKVSVTGLMEQQEVNVEQIKKGKRANWGSTSEPYAEEERKVARQSIEHVYDWFLDLVEDARNIEKEHLRDNLAGGRVWTGKQAVEKGLVDENGSLKTAIKYAAEMAGLKDDPPVVIFHSSGKSEVPPLALPEPAGYLQEIKEHIKGWKGVRYWAIEDNSLNIKDA